MTTRLVSPLRALVLVVCFGCGSSGGASSVAPTSAADPIGAWSDEFDGPAGAPPNPAVWTADIGNNNGWGNAELERYTNTRDNVRLDGEGHLVIRVEKTDDGFTSARLKTQGRRLVQFGRVEARIKLPVGQGIWPAFWALGATYDGTNWPLCGEIDLMENRGSAPSVVLGTVHGPGYSGGRGITATHTITPDDFHRFSIDWKPGSIGFYVDDVLFHTVPRASLPAGAAWVFDQQFFLLLNVAVGGNFVGAPDASTPFPAEMIVDYVRYIP